VGQDEIVQGLNISIWAGFTIATILTTRRVYRETSSPMYRNRYRYWLLSLGLSVVGDALFAEIIPLSTLLGIVVKLVGASALALAILRRRLVDIKRLYRQAFSYIAVSLLTVAISLSFVWIPFRVTGRRQLSSTLLSVGAASILISFAVPPTRKARSSSVPHRDGL
jgi:hypothetical protein